MSRVQFNNMIFVVVLVVEKCLIRNSPLFELLAFSRVTVNVRKKEQHQRQFNELFSQQTYLQQRLLYSHTHTRTQTHIHTIWSYLNANAVEHGDNNHWTRTREKILKSSQKLLETHWNSQKVSHVLMHWIYKKNTIKFKFDFVASIQYVKRIKITRWKSWKLLRDCR